MSKPFFLLTVLIGLLCSCHSSEQTKTAFHSRLVPEPDIIERLKYQKESIDSMFTHDRKHIEVIVKLRENSKLINFKDTILPDNTETQYNILRDSLGKLVAILENPYSESGDWYLTLTHYFDNEGKTFAFERQTNFFNSGCTEGVAYETKTEYYDTEFKQIGKSYKLVDEKERDLTKDSCALLYEYDYKVFPTVKKYLQMSQIQKN